MFNAMTMSAAVFLMGIAVLSAASYGETQRQTDRADMLVSTNWLQEHLADPNLVVLQVGRSREQYDAGHVPGARFVAFDESVEQHKESLNALPPVATLQAVFEKLGVGDDSKLVLYGEGGGLLAARLYFTLDYLGHGAHTGAPRWRVGEVECGEQADESSGCASDADYVYAARAARASDHDGKDARA